MIGDTRFIPRDEREKFVCEDAVSLELRGHARKVDVFFTLRPVSAYNPEIGAVLWWHLPVSEPPDCGSSDETICGEPTSCARLIASGWYTHWSPLPDPRYMTAVDGAKIHE